MREKLIKKYLTTEELGRYPQLFDIIPYSTNLRVAELIDEGKTNTLVVADMQEGGRGRVGRSWIGGKPGESIAMSFDVCPKVDITKLPSITLLVSLAVTDAIVDDKIKIKWPNDIYINDKKVCGILCELKQCKEKNYIIVGIGINHSQEEFSNDLSKTATSLFIEGIVKKDEVGEREKIVARVLNSFEKRLKKFEKEGFASQHIDYQERIYGNGRKAQILDSSISGGDITKAITVEEGIFVGINEKGEALIETASGRRTFSTGELSLRLE